MAKVPSEKKKTKNIRLLSAIADVSAKCYYCSRKARHKEAEDARLVEEIRALQARYCYCIGYSKDGGDALMSMWRAITNYNAKMMRLLLNAGADPNEAESTTPALQHAVREGYAEAVRLLLEAGAKPSTRNSEGRTALTAVARYAPVLDAECIRMLFTAGANPNLKDEEGLTALMRASSSGNTELAQLLLEGGANPDIQQAEGVTALMLAAFNGSTEAVRLLVDAGLTPTFRRQTA